MTGLLIKDLKLVKMQKNFFLLLIAVAAILTFSSEQPTFALSYLTFVSSMFTVSTIAYDEYDNGNAFLFSMPFTRTQYAVEKYLLGIILAGSSWTFSLLLAAVCSFFRTKVSAKELIVEAILILALMMAIQALLIPCALKFGTEKGRIAMIIAMVVAIGAGYLLFCLARRLFPEMSAFLRDPSGLNSWAALALAAAASACIYLVSLAVSISVLKKKEF